MKDQEYVCGLLFDSHEKRLALIQKRKGGSRLIGKWNGIGGKVEPGEAPHDAMQREFREEAGVSVMGWSHFLTLRGERFAVHFYCSFSTAHLEQVKTCEEEPIGVWYLACLPVGLMSNMKWIIPMALSLRLEQHVRVYDVREVEVTG